MSFSDDGTFVFCSANPDKALAPGDESDIYIAKYDVHSQSTSNPVNMGRLINSVPDASNPLRNGLDLEPFLSADGRRLYFRSNRLAAPCDDCVPDTHMTGFNSTLIFLSQRDRHGRFGTPVPLPAPINMGTDDHCASELRDERKLCFSSTRDGGYGGADIWCSDIIEHGKSYGTPVNQGPRVNSAGWEFHFAQHPLDGHVSFTSTRAGDADVWTTKKGTEGRFAGEWYPPFRLPFNQEGAFDACPAWAPDGNNIFWFSDRADLATPGAEPGTFDIYSAQLDRSYFPQG